MLEVTPPRYRCDACGNLTRFDVTAVTRSKAFHHYTVGGELEIEEEIVLSHQVEEVVCRWCGHGRSVVEIDADSIDADSIDADSIGADSSEQVPPDSVA